MHRHLSWIFVSHGAFSFWAFIPYSFLIIPSHPVESIIILYSTFLLPTNKRKIKHPSLSSLSPPPPQKKWLLVQKRNNDHNRLFLHWLKISYFTVYSRFSHFVWVFLLLFCFVLFFLINLLLAEKRWKLKKCLAANKCLPQLIACSQGPYSLISVWQC